MRFLVLIFCLIMLVAKADNSIAKKTCFIKPCELTGDFDGDKKPDRAVLVVDDRGLRGIQIKFGNKRSVLLGAGESTVKKDPDFKWMDRWSIHSGKIEQGANETRKPPKAKGDYLLLEQTNSASGIVYWDGSKFDWYQQGD